MTAVDTPCTVIFRSVTGNPATSDARTEVLDMIASNVGPFS
jgi:hypothetical protein